MPTIRKEIVIDARPDDVWAAVRDWGQPHKSLVPGFLTDTELDGDDRIVTFFNGVKVRELLVDLDEEGRRLVWSIVEGPYRHHNGAIRVSPEGDDQARLVWTADLLPAEMTEPTDQMMERGTSVMKETLESAAAQV